MSPLSAERIHMDSTSEDLLLAEFEYNEDNKDKRIIKRVGETMLTEVLNEADSVEPDTGTEELPTEEASRAAEPKSLRELLKKHEAEKLDSEAWIIEFRGLRPGRRAYNVSDIFMVGNVPHMVIREEDDNPSNGEFSSELSIWEYDPAEKCCYPPENPVSNLPELIKGKIVQDPAISYVKGKWVITWVEVTLNNPDNPAEGATWTSQACAGESLDALEMLVTTEKGTKGLRLFELLDHRIGVLARPDRNGKKRICSGAADDWEDITPEFLSSLQEVEGLSLDGEWGGSDDSELDSKDNIASGEVMRDMIDTAELHIKDNITPDGVAWDKADIAELIAKDDIGPDLAVWGGPNDETTLANGDISVLSHLGWYREKKNDQGEPIKNNRRYVGLHFVLTPGMGGKPARANYVEIIATIDDFSFSNYQVPPMRPDIDEVIYPCFVVIDPEGGPSTLVASLKDKKPAGKLIIDVLKRWRADHPEYAKAPFPESTYPEAVAA